MGGIATLNYIPKEPKQEFTIAVAGPLTNIVIGLIGFSLSYLPVSKIVYDYLKFFTFINFGICLFNIIPAFPMDGGRIFRSLIVKRFGYVSATIKAARLCKFTDILLVILSIVGIFSPLIIFIAIFIGLAAHAEEKFVWIQHYENVYWRY